MRIQNWYSRDKSYPVTRITVNGIKNTGNEAVDPNDPTKTLLHWRMNIVIEWPAESGSFMVVRSLELDTSKSEDKEVVYVQMAMKNYAHSISAVERYEWAVPASCRLTTQKVHDMIEDRGYTSYDYDASRSGCLAWVKTIIRMLEKNGYIPAGSYKDMCDRVQAARARGEYYIPNDSGFFITAEGSRVSADTKEPPDI